MLCRLFAEIVRRGLRRVDRSTFETGGVIVWSDRPYLKLLQAIDLTNEFRIR